MAQGQGFVILNEKEEFLNYYNNLQINFRNQRYNPMRRNKKKSCKDLEHLLSPNFKKSSRNVRQVIEPVDSF